uniref:Uncharacterized protein n=1 Tax=viral metagenome TaxID=1070528 RepID=A0A6C0D546_9ZZZZ
MELINQTNDINLIHRNYIDKYVLYDFLMCVFIVTIIFATFLYIRDKLSTIIKIKSQMHYLDEKVNIELTDILNKITNQLSDIENNKINGISMMNTALIRLDALDISINTNEKKMELLEERNKDESKRLIETLHKNIENTKKIKKRNDETILNIQSMVDIVSQQLIDMQDKINNVSKYINVQHTQNEIQEKINKSLEETNELIAQLQSRMEFFQNKVSDDIEQRVSTIVTITNKRVETLQEEIKNVSSGYTLIPITSGWQGFCNIHSEKMIFQCNTNGEAHVHGINLCIDDINNYLVYDITRCRNPLTGNILEGPLKFLEQFKKIKSLHFDFNGVCTNKSISSHIERILYQLFHKITEITPSIEIFYKCKDINPSVPPDILKEFVKTNKYSSFHLEVENNFRKDYQSENMSHISCPIGEKIKEHCLHNNIKFITNIGL